MINNEMRLYDYFTFGERNAYGQQTQSAEPKGKVKMAIYTTSQSVQANINYINASYVGLTYDSSINDSYIIQYGDHKLKVLYTTKQGRLSQVFMSKVV